MWIETRAALLPDATGALTPRRAAVQVIGQTIQAVHTSPDQIQRAHTSARAAGEVWEDHGDALLTPALIDAHTHLAMACFRGLDIEQATRGNVVEDLFFTVEQAMTADDVRAFARYSAYESLLHGVGLVWDHYYHGEALAEGLRDAGICAVVAPTLQDLSGPGAQRWRETLDTTRALADDPQWREAGIFAALGPHATDTVSDALWTTIRDESRARNLPVHAHVAQSIEEVERSFARCQTTPVALLDRLGLLDPEDGAPAALWVHGIYITRADLRRLDPARHTLCFCPSSQLIFNFPAHVETWTQEAIPWCVATDCAASNDSMSVQKELRMVSGLRTITTHGSIEHLRFLEQGDLESARRAHARREEGFDALASWADPTWLLDRVWSTPGRIHPAFTAGTIAPGALANLAIWDTTHPSMWPGTSPARALAMGDTTQALLNLMVNGQWLGATGRYHTSVLARPEVHEAREEATARFRELCARVGV